VLVIVGFDPADSDAAAAFRGAYGIDNSAALAGPWGTGDFLCNTWDVVSLRSPDEPPLDDPDDYPQVIEDEVQFFDSAPWSAVADGGGSSLQRRSPVGYGSLAASWEASAPTPGAVAKGESYSDWAIASFGDGAPNAGAGDDFNGDGISNLVVFALGLNPTGAVSPDLLPSILSDGQGVSVFAFSIPEGISGIEVMVEYSENLIDWTDAAPASIGVVGGRILLESVLPESPSGSLLARLRVTLP
jgi:hypothetical protein